MLHAYRLLYTEHSSAPDSLWEWHQPWIDHLLWHARTFGRQAVHGAFATWHHVEQANTHVWEMTSAPLASYALWPTWHAWLMESRELLVSTRGMYESHHDPRGTPWRP